MSLPATSACTSAGSGRRPSITTVTAVPGTGGPPNRARNSPDGSAIPTMPSSRSSKQPTSSAGPKRFFTPRTIRSVECLSPSNDSTTSTRCSSTRGPAIEPSLVTCPTSTTGSPRSLASPVSATVTARTWVTPPGAPSAVSVDMVCTESTTSSRGATASMWATIADRSDSAARYSASCTAPVRSARRRTCPDDSSPVT